MACTRPRCHLIVPHLSIGQETSDFSSRIFQSVFTFLIKTCSEIRSEKCRTRRRRESRMHAAKRPLPRPASSRASGAKCDKRVNRWIVFFQQKRLKCFVLPSSEGDILLRIFENYVLAVRRFRQEWAIRKHLVEDTFRLLDGIFVVNEVFVK